MAGIDEADMGISHSSLIYFFCGLCKQMLFSSPQRKT